MNRKFITKKIILEEATPAILAMARAIDLEIKGVISIHMLGGKYDVYYDCDLDNSGLIYPRMVCNAGSGIDLLDSIDSEMFVSNISKLLRIQLKLDLSQLH